jgi:protein-disulfide isomerase
MSKPAVGSKILIALLILVVGGAAWFGYSKQTDTMEIAKAESAASLAPSPDAPIFGKQSGDIVLGKETAPVTIIEYASLSCSHCAHFFTETLPTIQKAYIDSGKVKLVYRHFPLNAAALRAAQLVDCVDKNKQHSFLKVLYELQPKWAFDANFVNNLKQIANVGGIDSAAFDSCLANKNSETRILTNHQKATEEAKIQATPTLFINGKLYTDAPDAAPLKAALNAALKK